MLEVRKDIQPLKTAWSILHSELNTHVLPTREGDSKGRKTNRDKDDRISPFLYCLQKTSQFCGLLKTRVEIIKVLMKQSSEKLLSEMSISIARKWVNFYI